MLVQNLAATYKCYSSIGNSLNLEEMMREVLKTFVSESYAIYGEYCTPNENGTFSKLSAFGKIDNFDLNKYKIEKSMEFIEEEDKRVLIISLEYGAICLVSKNKDADCSFFVSMFESFINKLNVSINSCLNVEKLKETNELLIHQKEELEKANKAKDDFLANMSHELKTPLNSINVISSVMKRNTKENLDEKQIKNLDIINKCGNDLLFLINDVLDLSKLEAGKIELNYEYIDFPTFIRGIYDAILPQAVEKGLDFKLHIDKTISSIYTDDNRVKQIIKNLLSNSLKFTKDGEINLVVKDEDLNIRIIVSDQGIGIPKNKLVHIFNRFGQVDGTTTRKYGGTGLGLAICKDLAFLLKGDIKVSSVINKGTTFEVIIPKNRQLGNSYHYLDLDAESLEAHTQDSEDLDSTFLSCELIKNIEESILIFNNNPKEFFNMIISLSRKYKVIQTSDFDDFLRTNDEEEFKHAIVDISNLNNSDIKKLLNSSKNNFVVVYDDEDKFDKKLEKKVKLKIVQEELENALIQI